MSSTKLKKTAFHKLAKEKRWFLEEIAERWCISIRQMSRIANNPTQKDLDAANGLPNRNKKKQENNVSE